MQTARFCKFMEEEKIPIPEDIASDVTQGLEEAETPRINYAQLTLSELVSMFEELAKAEDRLQRHKEAEAIKTAFYRKLVKEKEEAGYGSKVDEPGRYEEEVFENEQAETASENEETALPEKEVEVNPFEAMEQGFKLFYNVYKRERAEYNRRIEAEKEANLAAKEAIISDLKALVEKDEDVHVTFPEFRQIQDRWKSVGPVPAVQARNINDTYHLYVENFYDRVSIDRELRDLDFKKNLEAKEAFCAQAEALAESDDVVTAFRQLQKLHEQWKEYGPVSKEYRESIWERFKAATAVINKKYQAYYEDRKSLSEANLAAKTALCEQVEEWAAKENLDREGWNAGGKAIEELQKAWKEIGHAGKKDNQKIYDRFRAACDTFFRAKKAFYDNVKDDMNANAEKKARLCEEAESLAASTDWNATSERLIALQKEWKTIGTVPRKKSEALWKRFRAACDTFFAAKAEAMKERRAAGAEKMARGRGERRERAGKSPLDQLMESYRRKKQELATAENNIGFFRNAGALLSQMQERLEKDRAELAGLEEKIRQMQSKEENNG